MAMTANTLDHPSILKTTRRQFVVRWSGQSQF